MGGVGAWGWETGDASAHLPGDRDRPLNIIVTSVCADDKGLTHSRLPLPGPTGFLSCSDLRFLAPFSCQVESHLTPLGPACDARDGADSPPAQAWRESCLWFVPQSGLFQIPFPLSSQIKQIHLLFILFIYLIYVRCRKETKRL